MAIIKYLNYHFATMPILVGLSVLLVPDLVSPFLFKDAPPSQSEMTQILLPGWAIRDIYMGISLWAAILTGSRKVVGWSLLAGLCVAAVDGYALDKAMGRGLWDHWSFLPVLAFCGIRQAFF